MQRTSLNLEIPISYSLEGEGTPVLLLHGYSDIASAARKRLLGLGPAPGFQVLAPNAPFPCPSWRNEKFREAYAWYFRDSETGEHLMRPEVSARALVKLVGELGLAEKTWIVLGFSQGGFFAPHVVREGLRARALITAGSGFRPEAYQGLPSLRVRSVHGEDDDLVPIEAARASFEKIKALGYGEIFHPMPGVKHGLDDAGRAVVRGWLLEEARA